MKHFDYSRGLKAPYSLQVIKSPKGKNVKNYVLDNRSIISFERVKEIEEFSFKR